MGKVPASFNPDKGSLEFEAFFDVNHEGVRETRDLFARMGIPLPEKGQYLHNDRQPGKPGYSRVLVNEFNFIVTVSGKMPAPLRLWGKKQDEVHPFGIREVEHPGIVTDLYHQTIGNGQGIFQINPGVDRVGHLNQDKVAELVKKLQKDGITFNRKLAEIRPEFFGAVSSPVDGKIEHVLVTKGIGGVLKDTFSDQSPTRVQEERFGSLSTEITSAFKTGDAAPVQRVLRELHKIAMLADSDPNKALRRHWEKAPASERREEMNVAARNYQKLMGGYSLAA